jgi:hypothetical protein
VSRREGAEDHHHRDQCDDERDVVLVEDHGDHVADRGQLDE